MKKKEINFIIPFKGIINPSNSKIKSDLFTDFKSKRQDVNKFKS